ncbi:RadC family protein [Synechococcus elongatus]|uniref:DNA repair protein RadC n=1 Tax=Synechococcus elongatus PCC 11801 TaxID=2219813 RepID=A0AAN1QPH5_SYNEL|nr:DNA repair protein RadC [Synechococcus elongatus]AZB73079.1 hypothetical protein DOP62_10430 [Synechococcus elongatus PCC 11801]
MATSGLRVADLPEDERPRERLMRSGPSGLSTAELLAILLGTGQGPGGLSAVGLGQLLLSQLGQHQREPLRVLRQITVAELMQIPGIGPAKATAIAAAIELGKRVYQTDVNTVLPITSPEAAAKALSADLMWAEQERFALLLLDVRHNLIGQRVLTIGTATETLANPREIFREALRLGATRLIVAHNHPSGQVDPSSADLSLTEQLLKLGQALELPVLDHLILGQGHHRSLRDTTGLWQKFPQGD